MRKAAEPSSPAWRTPTPTRRGASAFPFQAIAAGLLLMTASGIVKDTLDSKDVSGFISILTQK